MLILPLSPVEQWSQESDGECHVFLQPGSGFLFLPPSLDFQTLKVRQDLLSSHLPKEEMATCIYLSSTEQRQACLWKPALGCLPIGPGPEEKDCGSKDENRYTSCSRSQLRGRWGLKFSPHSTSQVGHTGFESVLHKNTVCCPGWAVHLVGDSSHTPKRLYVTFTVRAHIQVTGSISGQGTYGR